MLHYDSQTADLRPWRWPIVDQKRLPPSDFEQHSITHDFQNPCCFCAASATGISYTESVVCLDIDGPYSGEYVARCAIGGCKYFIPLERMYARIGVHLGRYGVRISPHVPRFFPAATVTRRDAVIAPNAPNHMNTFLQLLQLDSSETPGLSEVEFGNLFRKCRFCGTIVTRRAQQYHSCIEFPPVAIIDLTLDD